MLAQTLPITGPCPIDLDAIGFDRTSKVSHCTHCAKSVTILSNLTRAEARDFLREHQGQKMCVSYARDEDGRIRFRPEPEPALVPVTRLRPRPAVVPQPVAELPLRRASRAAGLVAAFGVSAALAACAPHGEPPRDTTTTVTAKPTATPPKPVVEPPKPVVEPEPVPLAGAAVIPQVDMVDGEIAVPAPDALDEPCDAGKPRPGTSKTAPPTSPTTSATGSAALPPERMVEGEIAVPSPEVLDVPPPDRPRPRR